MNLKEKVFEILDGGDQEKTTLNRQVNAAIMTLIILSVIAIILASYAPLRERFGTAFTVFELITIIIFSIEYGLRIWIADLKYPKLSVTKARLKFISSPMGMVDLVAILPFYLPFVVAFDLRFIRLLRILRLLRVLKLKRHSRALKIIVQIFVEKRSELSITLFVTFILLLISSSVMYNLENEAQPDKFPDIISTFWWAIATLTTVGYGDVFPITPLGKFFGGIIALLGIGMVALPTGIISAAFIEGLEEEKKKEDDQKLPENLEGYNYCPCCGQALPKK
ncbi:MAG: ion transporter [Saprospiraceae bacterium]|nr:ion transporter [Saprospiraceae bacterium]